MPNVIDFLSSPVRKLFSTGDFNAAVRRAAPRVPTLMILKGEWDARTNAITAETQTGLAWRVTVDGTTNLGGITDWKVGDVAVKTETGWLKIDNTEAMISFNDRIGAITLLDTDVTGALGFTPYNSSNPSGYISGVTSSQVTSALGYTPYSSANPNNYIALASAITGYASGTNTALSSSDTLLNALGKIQAQINAKGVGTVTSVSGTGTVSGLTLTGSVTGSGNLTLGGTLSLTSTNVTTALGFTPVNRNNTVTVNGSTQTLANNPSFTIAAGGNTVPFTVHPSSDYIAAGAIVKMTPDGYVSDIVSTYNYTVPVVQNTAVSGETSINSLGDMKTIVCPQDPTRVATAYVDGSSLYVKYGRLINGVMTYDSMQPPTYISNDYNSVCLDWDPFDKNKFIISLVTNSSQAVGYIVTVNDVNITSVSSSFTIVFSASSMFYGLKYSRTTAGQFVVVYVASSMLYAQVATLMNTNGIFTVSSGSPATIDSVEPSIFGAGVAFDYQENSDLFGVAYYFYNNGTATNRLTLFQVSGTSITPGSQFNTLDTNIYVNAYTTTFHFTSSGTFLLTFYNNGAVMYADGQFGGTSVYFVNSPGFGSDSAVSSIDVFFPTNSRKVFAILYSETGPSIKAAFGFIGASGASVSYTTTMIIDYNQSPDYLTIGNFYPAAGFTEVVDGKSAFIVTFVASNTFYYKTMTATHITKEFSHDSLLGIATTAGGGLSTVSIAPFGSVATVYFTGVSLTPGQVYYIADDGSTTLTKTSTKLGTILDNMGKMKTVSYPIND